MVTKISTFLSLISFLLLVSPSYPKTIRDSLRECINNDEILHFSCDPSYEPILEYTIQNLRLLNYSNPKPLAIVTPLKDSHVQSAVTCTKKFGLQIRVRSGGHDYEGMSYTSLCIAPFVLVDLVNLTKVDVDINSKTAWIQAGATNGQVYYWLNQETQDYSFVGGICPSVGVGGLITGGGIGYMSRKYGLSIDNVVDARMVDVNGAILDRKQMGEDLFWAIRGGGAASFGVIVAWKVQLVSIPRIVTVFNVSRSYEQSAVDLIQKSQLACYKDMNKGLRMRLEISTKDGATKVTFSSIFLGAADELLMAMEKSFPDLGLKKEDCKEMGLIDAVMYFYFPKGEPKESLRDRKPLPKNHFKAKSDFVTEAQPLSKDVIEELWKRCSKKEDFHLIMHSYGGRINEIPDDQTPFPFRKGILYDIEYNIEWQGEDIETANENIQWIRNLHKYMTPYVTKNPRGAYSNFRDYDLGVNNAYGATYEEARKWGELYFKSNFKHLAIIKGKVDPENFFALEQTVPPLKEIQQKGKKNFPPSTSAI